MVKSRNEMLESPVLMIHTPSRTQILWGILVRSGNVTNERPRHTSSSTGKSRLLKLGSSERVRFPVINFNDGAEIFDRLLLDLATKSPLIFSIPLKFIVSEAPPVKITFPVKLVHLLQVSASPCDAISIAPLGPSSAVQFSTATSISFVYRGGENKVIGLPLLATRPINAGNTASLPTRIHHPS